MNLKNIILIIIPLFTISAEQSNNKENQKMIAKLPNPKDLIDPKTGKPYLCPTDAWNEFRYLASQRDQIRENARVDIYLATKPKQ